MYQITITKVANGYSIKIGCMLLVTQSEEELITELSRYIRSPMEVEREYQNKYNEPPKKLRPFTEPNLTDVVQTGPANQELEF